jgi:zinc protease
MKFLKYAMLILGMAMTSFAYNQTIPIDPEVRMGELPNGMKYYIQQHEKPEDRAALRLVVHAGSLQEKENQLGLAHFVEHMAFNGTEHFEKNELISYLEKTGTRFGADLNAYTSFEETVYMIESRTDSLPLLEKGLLILEDWAAGLSFEEEEIDKERGVVVAEWRSRLSPDQRLQQQYLPVLYHDSRFAQRLPIGKPEIIENADYGTIRQFYADWYRPELMAVIAVGDFDLDWMEKEIKQRFAKLKNEGNRPERQDYTVPKHDSTLFSIATDKEAPFTQVRIMYKHPLADKKLVTKEDYRQHLSHLLYNRMLNARLQEIQLQADPPFTFAYSGYGSDVGDLGMYTLYAFAKEGEAIKGIDAVLKATQQAVQHGFLSSELDRQKLEMLESAKKAAREQDKIPSGSIAQRYTYHFLKGNPIPSQEQRYQLYQEMLPSIQLADINPLPQKWLNNASQVVIVTGPEKEGLELPGEVIINQLLDSIAKQQFPPYVDQVNNAPLLERIPSARLAKRALNLGQLDLTIIELNNGINLYLKPTDFQNDQILMTAFSPGGHSNYSDDLYFSASSAGSIVNQSGLADFTAIELQKKLAGKQVSVSPYIDEHYEGIGGNCSPDDLELLFQLIYLYFTAPNVDSTALASYLSRQASIYENLTINPYYYFASERSKIKYDNHIRRQVTTLEDLEKIKLDEIERVYKERFADASDFNFIFVGNFNVAQIQYLANQYLANLPVVERDDNWKDVKADLVKGKVEKTIVRGEAPKAIVEMTYHGDFDYEDANERYNFNSLLSCLRIRLREQLREDKGGVYGVRVSGNTNPIPSPTYRINISFNCDPDRKDELIEAVKKEVEAFKASGATAEEVAKVQETQRQSQIKGLKENAFWLGQLQARVKYDIPLEGILLSNFERYVDALSVEDIQRAAKAYLTEDNFIELVLMPEEE